MRGDGDGGTRDSVRCGKARDFAIVDGTDFTMVDRCDGTLRRVRSGVVQVRDFRLRRTVTVRAGQSYLARARR